MHFEQLGQVTLSSLRFHWTYCPFRPGVSFQIGNMPTVKGVPYLVVEAKGTVSSLSGEKTESASAVAGMTGMHIWPMKGPGSEHAHAIMCQLPQVLCEVALAHASSPAHPIAHWQKLWPIYVKVARDWGRKHFAIDIPELMIVCCAGIIDTAMWELLGQANRCYPLRCATSEYLGAGHYEQLIQANGGVSLADVIRTEPRGRLELWYTVGGTEPLTAQEAASQGRVVDTRPTHLMEYVTQLGLTKLKIKLGADPAANAARINAIDKLLGKRSGVLYWADANEAVRQVSDVSAFYRALKPRARTRLMGIEQPFDRALLRHESCNLARISEACGNLPIFVDEAEATHQDVLWAKLQGASGVCPKACRGVSETLLITMMAKRFGMRSPMMDLTCRAHSYLVSAGLAAWLDGTEDEPVLEANAHQMFVDWMGGMDVGMPLDCPFLIQNGEINTRGLKGVGFYDWQRT